MREQPAGDGLLEEARRLLREFLIPALPADKRHTALMIANAMGIALRQLKNGDAPDREEQTALERLLGLSPQAGPDPARLAELNRRLATLIRQGEVDSGPRRQAAHRHLLQVARVRVQESNPKYLDDASR